jgi:hypothetical protein
MDDLAWQKPTCCQFPQGICNNKIEYMIPLKGRKEAGFYICAAHAKFYGVDNAEYKI